MSKNKDIGPMVWLVWKLLPSCRDITKLISASHERTLSFKERLIMRIHVWSCLGCSRYLSQISFFGRILELKREVEMDSIAVNPVDLERIKERLKSGN